MASVLVLVTNPKVVKTAVNFLAFEILSNYLNNNLFYHSSSK